MHPGGSGTCRACLFSETSTRSALRGSTWLSRNGRYVTGPFTGSPWARAGRRWFRISAPSGVCWALGSTVSDARARSAPWPKRWTSSASSPLREKASAASGASSFSNWSSRIDAPLTQKIAYHHPCHLFHALKVRREPLEVLSAIRNAEIAPLEESDWCCGSAGSYNLTNTEVSMRLLDRKMGHVKDSGAPVVCV